MSSSPKSHVVPGCGLLSVLSVLSVSTAASLWGLNTATPRSRCLDEDGRETPKSDWWLWLEVQGSRRGDAKCSRWAWLQPLWPVGKPLCPGSRSMTVVYKVQFCRRSPVRSPAQNLHGKKRGKKMIDQFSVFFYRLSFGLLKYCHTE